MTLGTGTELGGYRIDGVIGAGGMGIVYEATQLALDRPVAFKLLVTARDTDELRNRFRREAMLQAALEHPNVVPVYEAGECEEGLFIAMKLIRGRDLKQLSENLELSPERTIELMAQAASALDAAHSAGLVHRDVKPQNILVDDDDHAYLADFGLTKGAADRGLTLTGAYTGSLDYAAPEQIRGETYSASSDLYAFAAVLYEALTGQVAFPYDTEAALLFAHLSEEPPAPSAVRDGLPSGLDRVIARGLAKTPGERFATATELVDAARAALASQPAEPGASPRRRFGETVVDAPLLAAPPVIAVERERHVPWQTIGLVAVVAVALIVGGLALGRETHASSDPQQSIARSGPVELTFPTNDWAVAKPPPIPGLQLEGTLALRSTRAGHPGVLVAGIAAGAEGPGLLPSPLRAELTGTAPAHAVAAGSLRGLEYPSLPAPKVPYRFSLLLVPTPQGAAAVACLFPRVLPAGTTPADCSSVAATLRLQGLRALPLGQTGGYAGALTTALTLLDGERLAGRRQLAGATTPAEEARAARVLQSGYASAAAQLAAIVPTPFARPAHAALVTAVHAAAAAYGALAAATAAHDERAYTAAANQVDATERTIDARITALDELKLP